MNIDGTTLVLFFLSPPLVAGPQKPQTLTASKPWYEDFRPKIQISHKKYRYLGGLTFQKSDFLKFLPFLGKKKIVVF